MLINICLLERHICNTETCQTFVFVYGMQKKLGNKMIFVFSEYRLSLNSVYAIYKFLYGSWNIYCAALQWLPFVQQVMVIRAGTYSTNIFSSTLNQFIIHCASLFSNHMYFNLKLNLK